MNKFKQSMEFNSKEEQFYYDQARQMMKDNGMNSIKSFINDEIPKIQIKI